MKSNLILVLGFLAICGAALYLHHSGKDKKTGTDPAAAGSPASSSASGSAAPVPAGERLEILFSTSDGKKKWVEEVTRSFNASGFRVGEKTVVVKLKHMKSGDSLKKILAGEEKPTVWSPATHAWIDLANQTWQVRNHANFMDESVPTVRTALVIAMWEPMARALGWPDRPIGWQEIVKVALDPKGWGSLGHPEWGRFKFGHSHPDYSTSAMLSLISLLYAETGKKDGLTAEDLKEPRVVEALTAVERAIVHYGESSSWLTEKICTKGPAYLSAVTLYESSVVQANLDFPKKPFPLVAIYPKEGTFWEEHPTGIVNADWVSDEQRQAGKLYLDYIRAPEQQAKLPALSGYRPADPKAPVLAPIDRAHGVDPATDVANALAPVSDDVFQRAQALWHTVKKKATVIMLIDTSGSMNGEPMEAAKRGAELFIKHMEPDDELEVVSFATNVTPLGSWGTIRDTGESYVQKVSGLFAEGNTALYDAIGQAMNALEKGRTSRVEPRLYGIVCLTDGKDTSSTLQRLDLLSRFPRSNEDTECVKVFTIGYGKEADFDFLKEISERSNAVGVKGDEKNVEKIYHKLASYF